MNRNAAGQIVLDLEDERRLNVMLASLHLHVRYSKLYTEADITEFVRDWRALSPEKEADNAA